MFLAILFLILIPSEDGLFLAPPALIGISSWTIAPFALMFGFVHFHKYSTLNCFRIVLVAIIEIALILPSYGLFTCIVGHVLWDAFWLMPMIINLIRIQAVDSART
jgi:hypothetical protein